MHMADALIVPAVAGTMYACSTAVAGYSVYKVRLEEETKKIPVMGVMGAFVFATQMINFTIPGTGSSGHLCGGMLLTSLLGPYGGFLTMIGVLLIQCLLFADGGLLALGCNVWNMAFYGCFIGALIWKAVNKKGTNPGKIVGASILGCVLTLQMGAFSVVLETLISGVTELPFTTFVALMQPIHLAIGLVEGLITAAVLVFVYNSRPELLWGIEVSRVSTKEGMPLKKVLVILCIVTVLIGGGLSLFASSNPDGLEWSIEKVTGDTELEVEARAVDHESRLSAYETASSIQDATALLPDYAFPDSEAAIGTSFSGVVGAGIVVLLCVGASYLFKFYSKKKA